MADFFAIQHDKEVMTLKTRTVGFYWNHDQRIPLIRLDGKKLENLGFTVGSSFTIERQYGQILLKTVEQ